MHLFKVALIVKALQVAEKLLHLQSKKPINVDIYRTNGHYLPLQYPN